MYADDVEAVDVRVRVQWAPAEDKDNDAVEKTAEGEEKKPERQEQSSMRLYRGRDGSREQREGCNGDENADAGGAGS
jgi:hypothetical protein